jgi:hypothetical protein
VQELSQLSLLDANITPIQNNKMQPASSCLFSPVNCNWGTDKNKHLTIIKPTQTGINRHTLNKLFVL